MKDPLSLYESGPVGLFPADVVPADRRSRVFSSPRFKHRGLLVDSARHFLPVGLLRRAVDGMASAKLSALHLRERKRDPQSAMSPSFSLHFLILRNSKAASRVFSDLTDSASFPAGSAKFPGLAAKGAYSPAATYTPEDLAGLVLYAQRRGVRVVPEYDMPAHSSFGRARPELASPSCPDQLNPLAEGLYPFLRRCSPQLLADGPQLLQSVHRTESLPTSCRTERRQLFVRGRGGQWNLQG